MTWGEKLFIKCVWKLFLFGCWAHNEWTSLEEE